MAKTPKENAEQDYLRLSGSQEAEAELQEKNLKVIGEMHQDYYNTFYATEHGRRVLLDLHRHFQTRFPDRAEFALANQALAEVYLLIQNNAGLNEEDVIAASAALLTEGD